MREDVHRRTSFWEGLTQLSLLIAVGTLGLLYAGGRILHERQSRTFIDLAGSVWPVRIIPARNPQVGCF